MLWYGDKQIEKNIRKIKILINQYRADPTIDYNKTNGILPSIVIFLKYGTENARLMLSKLEYYFAPYIDENGPNKKIDVYWRESEPTYFQKKNNLIYHTNGASDLDMHINRLLGSN